MNANYKPLQQRADRLQYRLQDCIDNGTDNLSRQAMQIARDVREDIESNKAPRSIEARIIQLQRRLEEIKAQPSAAMTPRDAGSLLEDYEDLRRVVRGLPNY